MESELAPLMMVPKFIENILIPKMPGECFLWTGRIDAGGYGYVRGGRRAHRVSYELAVGPIGPGLDLCHTCDVRNCVRPLHLVPGTRKENVHDAWAKGRGWQGRYPGEKNPQAKLSDEDVRQLKLVRGLGVHFKDLGRLFGVSASNAYNACAGISFKEQQWK